MSYSDMMLVAKELRKRIDEVSDPPDPHVLADILVGLQVGGHTPSSIMLQDEKALRELFSRKRQIVVQRKHNGWEIEIPTLPGSQVLGTELRPMFQMQLDQIITMHLLTKR